MNLEIKFRAWDKENKKMWWNVQNAYDTLACHELENGEDDDVSHDHCEHMFSPSSFGSVLDDENLVVMQYTGLKDKNGKEIYEGDIVLRFSDYPIVKDQSVKFIELYFPVVFHNGTFCAKDVNFYLGLQKSDEVVGNIFENPELLKGENQ